MYPDNAAASRADLRTLLDEVGHGLGHMADHIGTYERKFLAEVNLVIFQPYVFAEALFSTLAPPFGRWVILNLIEG